MNKDFLLPDFVKPEVPELSAESKRIALEFCKPAFGASEWIALRGGKKHYYFNFDKVYATPSEQAGLFHNALVDFLQGISKIAPCLGDRPPVLAFVCPEKAPMGIAQVRSIIEEHLNWPSVLVFPDKRLLRSRVMPGDGSRNFPESVKWLSGRNTLLLSDAATTGESIVRAAGSLRSFGCKVFAAAVVYNRGEGAEESLGTVGIPLYSLIEAEYAKKDHDLKSKIIEVEKKVRDFSYIMAEAA